MLLRTNMTAKMTRLAVLMFPSRNFSTCSKRMNSIQIKEPVKPPKVRWFYATDIPNTRPFDNKYKQTKRAEKFLPFTSVDSNFLESKFLELKESNGKSDSCEEVVVNEDGLFSVNLKDKLIKPTYWSGPSYEVRRGVWFDLNGDPVPDLLSSQIEENYSKFRPDYFLKKDKKSSEKHRLPEINLKSEKELYKMLHKHEHKSWPYTEFNDLSDVDKVLHFQNEDECILLNKGQLLPKSFLENLSTVGKYPNSILGVYPLKRGYVESENSANEQENKQSTSKSGANIKNDKLESENSKISKINELLGWDGGIKKLQNIMENDFSNDNVEIENKKDREIDHLILCVHGIGQTLSSKYTSINFVHDCNHLRQLIKSQFVGKPKTFVPLAYPEQDKKASKNCKVQVLPIIWRYDVNFGLDYLKKEFDERGQYRLPKLSSLNIDAVTPLRNLTADVLLDILLFHEPKFKEVILNSVIESANVMYDKFKKNNPQFNGKVSMIGHSLGSSIVLDILSRQPDQTPAAGILDNKKYLKFDVENFFALGSPNGVFKFIKSENIRSRKGVDLEARHDKAVYPKVNSFYNIFYSTDLVAYRVEPLIDPSMANLQPKKVTVSPEENILTDNIKNISKVSNDLISNTGIVKTIVNNAGWTKDAMNINLFKGTESRFDAGSHVEDLMFDLNKNGRVDYVLPQGLFDIDVISAIGSHTQYFDDPNVADLILQELWKQPPQEKHIMGVVNKPATANANAAGAAAAAADISQEKPSM